MYSRVSKSDALYKAAVVFAIRCGLVAAESRNVRSIREYGAVVVSRAAPLFV